MKRASHAAFLAFLLAGATASAQERGSDTLEAGLPFLRTFAPKDYGGAAQSWAIVQDARGVIYVGNNDGVLEFDGVRWRLIRTTGGTLVRSLALSGDRIWVGGVGEIGYLEPDALGQQRYTSALERIPSSARDFADVLQTLVGPEGLYFLTAARLFRLRGDEVKVWLPETTFHASFLVGKRLFVRQMERGLFELVEGQLRLVPGGEVFAQDRVCVMLPWEGTGPGQPGAVLIGSRIQGFFLLDGASLRPFPTDADAGLKRDLLYAGTRLTDGRLALGTVQGGLYLLDARGRWLGRLDKARGLPDETVYALASDREGGLWLGLNRGLARVQVSSPLTRFDEHTGLPGTVHSLHRHRGRLHAGTNLGLFRLEEGPEPRFRAIPGGQDQTWGFLSAGESLLVANNQGTYEVVGDTAALLRKESLSLASEGRVSRAGGLNALAASQEAAGRVYVGLRDGVGSLRRDGGRWVDEGRIPGASGPVRRLLTTPDGRLWAGTRNAGLLRLTIPAYGQADATPQVERFGTSHGLPSLNHDYPHAIGGQTLFATHAGILRFDEGRGRFEPDPRFSGLFPDGPRWVYALHEDSRGRVWMHAMDEARGLAETGAAVPRPDGTYRWEPLRPIEGLGVASIVADPDGVVWLGGDEGLFRYDPRVVKDAAPSFPTLVRRVSHPAGGAVLYGGAGQPLARGLAYQDNALRFEYAAPLFEGPDATRFQVWLEGYDRDWSPWTAEGFREYTNLREGSYRFRVRARNVYGRLSEEAVYRFLVRPPWFRTVPAYLGYLLLAGGLAWGLVHVRLRRLRAEKRELEATVLARTAELRQAQEKIGQLLESVPAALEDIRSWSQAAAREIAETIGAQAIEVWELERGTLVPVSESHGAPPSLDELRRASTSSDLVRTEGGTVVPVTGMSRELYGALVVRGDTPLGETPRRLLGGLAHQLGGGLELHRLKGQLEAARERKASTRLEMQEKGIATLQTCPSCGRCYDQASSVCAADGWELESTRLLPYRLLGRYRFLRVLGQGGMGTVFAVHDEKLGRDVAVKLIRPEYFASVETRLRFEREVRIAALIEHPGVVALHDSGELPDGSAFLVMEKLVGRDLSVLLSTHGPGRPREIAELVRQGAAALRAAHRVGIIHRDVKPENVFRVDDPGGVRFKLLDFGLAKPMGLEKGMTRTGMVVGTPQYMSPEQVQGEPLDTRTDVYSFAAVCYEALTGFKAVSGYDVGRVMINVLNVVPPPVSSLVPGTPPEVDAAFDSALAKDRARRLKDVDLWASSFLSALESLADPPGRKGWTVTRDGPATPSP